MIETVENVFFCGIGLGMVVGALFDEFLYWMDSKRNEDDDNEYWSG